MVSCNRSTIARPTRTVFQADGNVIVVKMVQTNLVQLILESWQDDTDLAGIRNKDAVAKLPPDEQEACKKLWADVEALLNQVEGKPK
jgi:hypothetical protein